MLETDRHITELRRKAVEALLKKRKALQATADELAATPASYSIVGSVSVTSQKIDDIKAQISEIDLQIRQLVSNDPCGINLAYPNYRWRGWL